MKTKQQIAEENKDAREKFLRGERQDLEKFLELVHFEQIYKGIEEKLAQSYVNTGVFRALINLDEYMPSEKYKFHHWNRDALRYKAREVVRKELTKNGYTIDRVNGLLLDISAEHEKY